MTSSPTTYPLQTIANQQGFSANTTPHYYPAPIIDNHRIRVDMNVAVIKDDPSPAYKKLLDFTRARNYRAKEFSKLCSHIETCSNHPLLSPEEKAKLKVCVHLFKEIRKNFKDETEVIKKQYTDAQLAIPIAIERGDALKNPKKSKPKQEVNILDYVNTK